ncbi:GNAT family N-acetyltransferase [Shewanella marina]|uniref:GNAT family N-acetyltransferase n=1 Tax=Shewanella marina TaxID=487319 RepID=UPI000AEACAF8|nr:N-acetyltransferase [Shewanella marina]
MALDSVNYSLYLATDKQPIEQVYLQTFSDAESEAEGLVIAKLVTELLETTAVDELFTFVATQNGQVIACIMFSKLTFEQPINAWLLSPVAVLTQYQRKGIGQQLLTFGLQYLAEQKTELVFTYGDPNYYCKVGFNCVSETVVKAPMPLSFPEGWLGLSLVSEHVPAISGFSSCVAAFNKPEIW